MTTPAPILCATDFSEPAAAAAHRAAHVARDTGASLTLIHVLPGSGLGAIRRRFVTGSADDGPIHAEVEQRLQHLAAELAGAWQVRSSTVHAIGTVADEILFEASSLDAGILVVGARGAGTLRRLILGTTAERLLRRSTRPVLVVRRPPADPYRRVLVALDFSASSAAVLAAAIATAPQARFVLMHVLEAAHAPPSAGVAEAPGSTTPPATRRLQDLADAAGLAPLVWEAHVVEGDASQRILEQAGECDLLVVGKHGRTVTQDLLVGSATQHMIAEASTDLLISPAPRD